jgi:predicted Holliday junction resolvase-like endonuclease
MKYRKQGLFVKIISSRISVFVLVLLFIFLTKVSIAMREKLSLSQGRLNTAQSELDKLINHQNDLAKKIQFLSTEAGIESELRTKYRAVREGESVAVILDAVKLSTSTATTTK